MALNNRRQEWWCGRGHLKIPREPVDVLEKMLSFFLLGLTFTAGNMSEVSH
jgi:hypothetical protein